MAGYSTLIVHENTYKVLAAPVEPPHCPTNNPDI